MNEEHWTRVQADCDRTTTRLTILHGALYCLVEKGEMGGIMKQHMTFVPGDPEQDAPHFILADDIGWEVDEKPVVEAIDDLVLTRKVIVAWAVSEYNVRPVPMGEGISDAYMLFERDDGSFSDTGGKLHATQRAGLDHYLQCFCAVAGNGA